MRRLVLALALACASLTLQAQSAAPISLPVLQFFDANGVPLAGGKIYTYLAGTLTPAATYKDSSALTLNANPIILDAGGFANIWIGAQSYKFIVKNSANVQQWSADNVSNLGLQALAKTPIYQDPSGGLPQTINSGLTVNGDVNDVGHYTVTGNQDVTGNSTVGGTQAVTGNATVGGTEAITGNTTIGGTLAVTGNVSGAKYTSTVATGTAPLVVASTTPVPNLTTVPLTYNHAGTQQTAVHLVVDVCVLGTNCNVTFTGAAVFTSATSYVCNALDQTSANAVKGSQASGSAVTFTGTGTDTIFYSCSGN